MPEAVRTFLANNAVGIVGIAITAALAYYFYARGRRTKEPCWAVKTTRLVTDQVAALPGIAINFNLFPIRQLSVSRMIFYNKGSETIRREDIAETAPLRIVASDKVRILGASLMAANNSASDCAVTYEIANNRAGLTFSYLDRRDGCVIEVIHTGSTSTDIRLTGAIIGVPTLRTAGFGTNALTGIATRYVAPGLIVAFILFFSGAFIRDGLGQGTIGTFIEGAGIGVLAITFLLAISATFTPSESVPKGLESFSQ